jgi:hypothetical protein
VVSNICSAKFDNLNFARTRASVENGRCKIYVPEGLEVFVKCSLSFYQKVYINFISAIACGFDAYGYSKNIGSFFV